MFVVRYCTKDRIDDREGVRLCLGPVPFGGSSREERIIVIRVVHMELVRADAKYWTTWIEKIRVSKCPLKKGRRYADHTILCRSIPH
jgi:hypothetical protein